MADELAVPVHSIQEEHLYVLLQRCGCGNGYELVSQTLETGGERPIDRVTVRCQVCRRAHEFRFDVSGFYGDPEGYAGLQVNPTPHPSRAIDLEGWTKLALFYLNMMSQARTDAERVQITYMAAQCIDEAVKLFPPGAEHPNPDAFFNTDEVSRQAALTAQETFRRSYLRQLREPLPPTEALRDQLRKLTSAGDHDDSDRENPTPE